MPLDQIHYQVENPQYADDAYYGDYAEPPMEYTSLEGLMNGGYHSQP
jgi:hypothetical protein